MRKIFLVTLYSRFKHEFRLIPTRMSALLFALPNIVIY